MFNINEIAQTDSFKEIEPGIYEVTIESFEGKETNSGGQMLVFVLKTTHGKITHRLTWSNKNSNAVRIGHSQLADLLFTLQINSFNSPAELSNTVGKKLLVKTTTEIYNDKNYPRVVDCYSLGGKHRNPSNSLQTPVVLGPTGEKLKQANKSPIPKEEVPF
jgi:hypothetical protein